jgi:radical SAM superfamily enzyme YgiQ (UPF0313 family)
MKALLISTYDMGRQPFGLASPAAWLKAAGWGVTCVDVSKQKLNDVEVTTADIVGFHLPMHTATRLAAPLISKVRVLNPAARICAFGLYAPLNEQWLNSLGVDRVLGGEFEADLAGWVNGTSGGPKSGSGPARLQFLVPDRSSLPALSSYATLQMPDGSRRLVGYTEASRGCKHLCRHCPVVPIYNGQFRIVQSDVVLADIDSQVAAGASHITFGDPDFFNGPTHAMRIVDALHAAHPSVSYDVTIKVEHLLKHRELLSRLAETGCAFVTSAVESIDDTVLQLLAKGHTRQGFEEAVALCRDAGVVLVPTFIAFHPWLSMSDYCALLDTIEALDLVEQVASIQLAIRLLVPNGSYLLTLPEMRPHLGAYDAARLTYQWSHPDPRVDELHRDVSALVGAGVTVDRRTTFEEISSLAHDRAGLPRPDPRPARARATVPYLNEPWYC